jgi:HK97 family phage major capsid protein
MTDVLSADDEALDRSVWIMSSRTKNALALLRGSGGAQAFPTMSDRIPTLLGRPVFTSGAAYASGSPGEAFIVLLDPRQILLADPGIVEIVPTRQSAVQMSDTPTAGATTLTSLWQSNLVAVAAERWISWKRTSDTGVVVLSDVTY